MTARPGIVLALLGLASSGGGCVSPFSHPADESRLAASGAYEIVTGLEVPAVRGTEGCGAQALATVLAHHDPRLEAAALADELPWHDQGATPVDLLLAARGRGFRARVARGDWESLAAQVRRGEPPLVMLDAGPEVPTLLGPLPTIRLMHWSVLSGVAVDGGEVLLAGAGRRHFVVPREDFLKRWARSDHCMIVVTPAPREESPPAAR